MIGADDEAELGWSIMIPIARGDCVLDVVAEIRMDDEYDEDMTTTCSDQETALSESSSTSRLTST